MNAIKIKNEDLNENNNLFFKSIENTLYINKNYSDTIKINTNSHETFLCTDCLTSFDDYNFFKYYKNNYSSKSEWAPIKCPYCGAEIIQVDELFLPIIKILNTKGYKTLGCCSGHAIDEILYTKSYISFINNKKDFKSIPFGYEIDKEYKKGFCIKKIFSDRNSIQMGKEILLNAYNVLEWAEALPELGHKEEYN